MKYQHVLKTPKYLLNVFGDRYDLSSVTPSTEVLKKSGVFVKVRNLYFLKCFSGKLSELRQA